MDCAFWVFHFDGHSHCRHILLASLWKQIFFELVVLDELVYQVFVLSLLNLAQAAHMVTTLLTLLMRKDIVVSCVRLSTQTADKGRVQYCCHLVLFSFLSTRNLVLSDVCGQVFLVDKLAIGLTSQIKVVPDAAHLRNRTKVGPLNLIDKVTHAVRALGKSRLTHFRLHFELYLSC